MPSFDLLDVAAALTNPANANMPALIALAVGALIILASVAYAVLKGWQPRRRKPREIPPADLERLFAAIEALKRGEKP